jgi:hypothetical protein
LNELAVRRSREVEICTCPLGFPYDEIGLAKHVILKLAILVNLDLESLGRLRPAKTFHEQAVDDVKACGGLVPVYVLAGELFNDGLQISLTL